MNYCILGVFILMILTLLKKMKALVAIYIFKLLSLIPYFSSL